MEKQAPMSSGSSADLWGPTLTAPCSSSRYLLTVQFSPILSWGTPILSSSPKHGNCLLNYMFWKNSPWLILSIYFWRFLSFFPLYLCKTNQLQPSVCLGKVTLAMTDVKKKK